MASKVMLKFHVPFNNQLGKKGDVVRGDSVHTAYISSDPLLRITQLEQNIKFLQEQHQQMLASLHEEIESLRVKNRDLQFQLIFGKTGVSLLQSSSESSPEDNTKMKMLLSPKEVNTQSLQVEMLEKEVSELKTTLAEANSKNTSLNQINDQLNKQIENMKKDSEEKEYAIRLEEADSLIKKLMTENEDQRKEMIMLRNQHQGGRGGSGGGSRARRDHHQRFPPLQGHNYWHQRNRNSLGEYLGPGEGGEPTQPAPLPHLTRGYSGHQPRINRTRYFSNGNQFYQGTSEDQREGGSRRKYRGGGGGGGGGHNGGGASAQQQQQQHSSTHNDH